MTCEPDSPLSPPEIVRCQRVILGAYLPGIIFCATTYTVGRPVTPSSPLQHEMLADVRFGGASETAGETARHLISTARSVGLAFICYTIHEVLYSRITA